MLENGSQVLNSTKDRKERIGKIYQMHANKREELPRAGPARSSPSLRRIVHLALRDESDLHTESEGEGANRCLVVYPKDYKGGAGKPAPRTLP